MRGSPQESFDTITHHCLGKVFPQELMNDWEKIYRIRNQASHVHPLDMDGYKTILEKSLSPNNLNPLARIKLALSGH